MSFGDFEISPSVILMICVTIFFCVMVISDVKLDVAEEQTKQVKLQIQGVCSCECEQCKCVKGE